MGGGRTKTRYPYTKLSLLSFLPSTLYRIQNRPNTPNSSNSSLLRLRIGVRFKSIFNEELGVWEVGGQKRHILIQNSLSCLSFHLLYRIQNSPNTPHSSNYTYEFIKEKDSRKKRLIIEVYNHWGSQPLRLKTSIFELLPIIVDRILNLLYILVVKSARSLVPISWR